MHFPARLKLAVSLVATRAAVLVWRRFAWGSSARRMRQSAKRFVVLCSQLNLAGIGTRSSTSTSIVIKSCSSSNIITSTSTSIGSCIRTHVLVLPPPLPQHICSQSARVHGLVIAGLLPSCSRILRPDL